jgi:Memo-like protein
MPGIRITFGPKLRSYWQVCRRSVRCRPRRSSAGYIYSGRVAATAFAPLRGRASAIERVVVIGPAHYIAVRRIASPMVDAFETPLGRLPVDHDSLAAITARRLEQQPRSVASAAQDSPVISLCIGVSKERSMSSSTI